MKTRSLLPLLYAGVFGILFILSLLAGYTLAEEQPVAIMATTTAASRTAPEAQQASAAYTIGRRVWNANACGSCHNKNMKDDMTGPALRGVTERWADYPEQDLYDWIRNSQALVAAQHPRALVVWKENDKRVMSNYPNLTDEELEGLLAFIEE
ncbi:cytochrome c [Neolewinella aurantiaca]|uniref:Cytochrome c n=1 Tax=Neolewinella aurantiaca TaxID=2602767 RepID=A0A5C7FUH5_9BACT|nr:cytochrome c [Neolewinella aurantiaca]TXF89071.1 cytochrome c [Neolewinella aurantiaca]